MSNDIVSLTIPQAQDISKCISVCGSIAPDVLFNRISEPKPVSEVVNTVVEIHGVYCSTIDIADKETGEITRTPLMYVITADGALVSRSSTVIRSVMTFFNFMGPPSVWPKPYRVKFFTQRGSGGETFYNLKFAKEGEK